MRLEARQLLANDSGGRNRQRILNALANAPGLNFRGLVAATSLAAGTVKHHVLMLERAQLVHTVRHGIHVLHFAGDKPPTQDDVRAALLRALDDGARAVYDHVQAHPGKRQSAILDALPGQVRSTVQHRLRRLVGMGLLKRDTVGLQGIAYYTLPTPDEPEAASGVKPTAPDAPGFGPWGVRESSATSPLT